jgi:hypothetical protein
MTTPAFSRLVHADWSLSPAKRWAAEARRVPGGWQVAAPALVGDSGAWLQSLHLDPGPVLVGVDFPIGLPRAFADRAGITDFRRWLTGLSPPDLDRFLTVCRSADDIALTRPFYPQAPGGRRLAHLIDGLGLPDGKALLRDCERPGPGQRRACPMFWTLGANQVGKAAITGWRELVVPALRQGAALWPFDGDLAGLSRRASLVLCETYPADACHQIGADLAGGSKRRQADRARAGRGLPDRCARHGIALDPALADLIATGFGPDPAGEDPFDALIGLLAMIEVVEGRHPPGAPAGDRVEGWILGRQVSG